MIKVRTYKRWSPMMMTHSDDDDYDGDDDDLYINDNHPFQ